MKICDLLDETHIIFDLKPGDKAQVQRIGLSVRGCLGR